MKQKTNRMVAPICIGVAKTPEEAGIPRELAKLATRDRATAGAVILSAPNRLSPPNSFE